LAWIVLLLGIVLALACPLVPAAAAPSPWSQLDSFQETAASRSNLLVAEFSGGRCQAIHERNADLRLAVASTFKLYVLGELGRQLQSGAVAWNDQVVLSDTLRSMPSGDYAFAAPGTRVSIRDLAEAMIWKSDNTATDHLIHLLGRENVERAFGAFGHGDPAINTPLLLTRELFAIKMLQSTDWMITYTVSDDAEQLRLLETHIDPLRLDPAGGWRNWNGPTAIDGIEWFASASDLCRVMSGLWTMGAQPGLEPLRDILTGNRGGISNEETWRRAGYKGGYEAGVVNMTFVLERSDERIFFVSAGYNDPQHVLDTGTLRSKLNLVFACLGETAAARTCVPPANAG
jgi:hypothetical protein